MVYRDYMPSDRPALLAMKEAQGFQYDLPDLDDPRLWISRKVLVNQFGRPIAAILGQLTSEAFLLDSQTDAGPYKRMRRILSLYELACEEARSCGMETTHAWLAPDIKDKFGDQLMRLGWREHTWASFSKALGR